MAYTSKQASRESQASEQQHVKPSAQLFSDQRTSTSVQLQQQHMMNTVQRATNEEEPLQGKFATVQREEEEELLQGKFETTQRAAMEEEEPIQGKFETLQRAGVEEEEPLQGKFNSTAPAQREQQPNNTGLPDNLKSGIENMSGYSMDDVKVHYNSDKPAQLNAHAYAQGTDIHVAPGQEQHLPHEAWHVVQQKQGRVQPTMQMKAGVPVNDDAGLENEADVMGAKALEYASEGKTIQSKLANTTLTTSLPVQRVITRSMQKIISETEFKSDDDMNNTGAWLASKYGSETACIIVNGILDKNNVSSEQIDFLQKNSNNDLNEQDEEEVNFVDHGDLNEYDNPEAIDQYISEMQITQLARKGNTESGPKTYATKNVGSFKDVSYKTDGKGCIDFSNPFKKKTWSNPVLAGSKVNLSSAKKTIDTKNRAQHFAIGDLLYANNNGFNKASDTTKLRSGKWTWHHLPAPYEMVLVDMTVHAKHGHNGGVYLW
jgi:hypothetical protein